MALMPVFGIVAQAEKTPEKNNAIPAAIKPASAQQLFNGKNFDGWRIYPGKKTGASDTWTISDGMLRCGGKPAGYVCTTQRYRDYRLFVEWRWNGPAPLNSQGKPITRNSGVLLHMQGIDGIWPKSLEAQLMEWNAGDFWVIEGVETVEWRAIRDKALEKAGTNENARKSALENRRIAKAKPASEKPIGEWNTYEIVCRGDTVVISVNGVEQNRATGVSVSEGYICLQSEGSPIDFRNVRLEPL
jgi:hypothetical protein